MSEQFSSIFLVYMQHKCNIYILYTAAICCVCTPNMHVYILLYLLNIFTHAAKQKIKILELASLPEEKQNERKKAWAVIHKKNGKLDRCFERGGWVTDHLASFIFLYCKYVDQYG